jgi:hypothetical protein
MTVYDELDESNKEQWRENIFTFLQTLEFRAWDSKENMMLYSGFILNCRGDVKAAGSDYGAKRFFPMQYTSFTDSKGEKIFHSDILKVDDNYVRIVDGERNIVLVGYRDGSFMYGRSAHYYHMNSYLWMPVQGKHVTVIGNIYENSELLGP